MKYFSKIADGVPVDDVLEQLHRHPKLWAENTERIKDQNSPHYGVDDIWVRYRARAELTSPEKFIEPHFAVFYPAWHLLPALKPIVFGLMSRVQATYLGGILITKIPPGGSVKPHDDRGGWHAETMDKKVYVSLQSSDKCVNYCGDEAITIKTGEAWTFDNQVTHSVENNGSEDRITLIVCMKTT